MKSAITALVAALVLVPAAARAEHGYVGLGLDAGGPQGLGASVVVRPVSWLRLHGGATTDLAAPGVRGGFTLAVPWYIGPALTAEAGYQWPGNFNHLARLVTGNDPHISLLDHVGYRYASLQAGLDLGWPRWFQLTLRAGYSAIAAETSGLPAYVASQAPGSTVRVGREASVRVLTPSASVGLLFYVR